MKINEVNQYTTFRELALSPSSGNKNKINMEGGRTQLGPLHPRKGIEVNPF